MSENLTRLYERAVLSGWAADWQAYYLADERERQARLTALERESR
jgi:hypothetical protein